MPGHDSIFDRQARIEAAQELNGLLQRLRVESTGIAETVEAVRNLFARLRQPPFVPEDMADVQAKIDALLADIFTSAETLNRVTDRQIEIKIDGVPVP